MLGTDSAFRVLHRKLNTDLSTEAPLVCVALVICVSEIIENRSRRVFVDNPEELCK